MSHAWHEFLAQQPGDKDADGAAWSGANGTVNKRCHAHGMSSWRGNPATETRTARRGLVQMARSTSATLSAALSGPYSSRCASPSPAADQHTDVEDALALLRSFQLSVGFFSGEGGDTLFSPRATNAKGFARNTFSMLPHGVSRTTEPNVLHLTATLTMTGVREHIIDEHEHVRGSYRESHSISFFLDGYYSSASAQLCMVGMGRELSSHDTTKHYADVALRLRIPNPSSLIDPFVTGSLEGADFVAISLVTYVDGSNYKYSESASCTPGPDVATATRRALQTTADGDFPCAALKKRLSTLYVLEHGCGHAQSFPSRHEWQRMYVNQVHCTVSGAVRAYAVFSNDTTSGWASPDRFFSEPEAAVVADGHWDTDTNQLCLRACLVVRSPPPRMDLEVRECGIGMSFWFPAVWTVRDRSVTAGVLWNSSEVNNSSDNHANISSDALITVSSSGKWRRGNLSDVTYNYNFTMLAAAKKHLNAARSNSKKQSKGSFPGNYTYSYRDFDCMFSLEGDTGNGRAYPVSIGSAIVDGDKLAAEASFSQHAAAQLEQSTPVNISYVVMYSVAPKNWSSFGPLESRQIWAEGVYDPSTGYLSLVGCGDLNGSMDCEISVTIQFTSFGDDRGFGHGWGRISSLRDSTDRLYFPRRDITLFGMYSHEVSASIWRMDMESVVVVISTTMSCIFTVLQILHTKRIPKAAAFTSITMLAVQSVGLVTPLVVDFDLLFINRRKRAAELAGNGWLELNELMLRVPALIAFALQLRLLQLALSGRRRSAGQGASEGEASLTVAVDVESKVLRMCLPLYLIGAAVTALANVIFNALSGSTVKAISPWFYVGGTAIRAAPHAYNAFRAVSYTPSRAPSYVYASSRDDLFGVTWDIAIPLGAAALAFTLFWQQRVGGGGFLLRSRGRRSGEYELVSTFQGHLSARGREDGP
ncbi:hypothetical protein ABZP36_027896 [Zizania latifolia]